MKTNRSLKIFFSLSITLFLLLQSFIPFVTPAYSAGTEGTLDTTFSNSIYPGGVGINRIAVQSDGKIVIVGSFRAYQGVTTNFIARLNSDLTLDTTFNVGGTGANNTLDKVTILSDGKILIYGDFSQYNGTYRPGLARLNSDGSLDTSFVPNLPNVAPGYVLDFAVQSDGKVIVAGRSLAIVNGKYTILTRLNTDGSTDSGFTVGSSGLSYANVNSVMIQSDGKIIAGGSFGLYDGVNPGTSIVRLNTDGTVDTSFNPGTGAKYSSSLAIPYIAGILSNGKIVIYGTFTTYNDIAIKNVARINSDGSLDTSFNPGTGVNLTYSIKSAILESDGEVIISGKFTKFNGTDRQYIAKLDSNGSLTSDFSTLSTVDNYINCMLLQSNGKILLGGDFIMYDGVVTYGIARLLSDYTMDSTFLHNAGADTPGYVVTQSIQPNGKTIIFGTFDRYRGVSEAKMARLNSDGTLDTSFNVGTGPDYRVDDIITLPNGKILLGGNFEIFNGVTCYGLILLNSDGSIDTSFTSPLTANDYVDKTILLANGKILIVGYLDGGATTQYMEVLNTDGTVDTSFTYNPIVDDEGYYAVQQSDGKIIVGGYFSSFADGNFHFVRLNTDGTLDTSFSDGTGLDEAPEKLIVLPNDKILISGIGNYNGNIVDRIARINSDGSFDTEFTQSDSVKFLADFAVQKDGKIVIADYRQEVWHKMTLIFIGRVLRLNEDGSLDTTFNSSIEADNEVTLVGIQPDGGILAFGTFNVYGNTSAYLVTRLLGTPVSTGSTPTGSIAFNPASTYATSSAVSLSLTTSDEYQMMVCNNESMTGCSWETFASSKSWTLSDGDGNKTVYVKFKNSEGTESTVYSSSITLDTQSPTGAVLLNMGTKSTISPTVTLSLSAADDTSGLSQMMLSTNSSFTGSSWEPYSSTKSYTFPTGDGQKVIYVKYMDKAGLISDIYTGSILLNTYVPPEEDTTDPVVTDPVITEPDKIDPVISEPDESTNNTNNQAEDIKSDTPTVLSLTFANIVEKVGNSIKTLPVSEESSRNITAATLTIIAVSPAISAGIGNSYAMAYILRFFSGIFAFFGIGRKKRNCGLVYDSVTKEPISNAVVRIYTQEGTLVATEVTNVYGIFETDIESGNYNIIVKSNSHVFPSNLITTQSDLPYTNIYRGGDFKYDSSSTLSYSIPVDPLEQSMIEYGKTIAKNRFLNFTSFLFKVITIIGLTFSIIAYLKEPSTLNLVLLLLYVFFVLLGLIVRSQEKYRFGTVTDLMDNPQEGLELGLLETEFNTLYAKRVTNKNGKYRFIVPKGSYRLVSLNPNYNITPNEKIVINSREGQATSAVKDLIASRIIK